MNSTFRFLIVFAMVVLGIANMDAEGQSKDDAFEYRKVYRNVDKIRVQIERTLSELAASKSMDFDGQSMFFEEALAEFYKSRNYAPAWGDFTTFLDALYALERSWEDGLNPKDYHVEYIRSMLRHISEKLDANMVDYESVARFDILVTDAVLLYAWHLLKGKVDSESLEPNWNYDFRESDDDFPEKLQHAIAQNKVSETLYDRRPEISVYKAYRDLLVRYRTLKLEGVSWKSIDGSEWIKQGARDLRVPLIRARLYKTGELSGKSNMDSLVYDDQLVGDIENFQRANGLGADGVIGTETLNALNESLDSRIGKLRVNMERLRWVIDHLSDRYILVNIPAFKAYYMENNKLRFVTNVIIGQVYTRTPVFKSRLSYIEFNPTWTVPSSIIRSSIIPDLKKDPEYLGKNHYVLLDRAGNKVDQSKIDFSTISRSNFPYIVRQRPGNWNALGVVKFIFPNKYSVFMHDTPSKQLFERSQRTFSHGCIRIQNPLVMAEILLEGTDYDKTRIDEVLKSGKTIRVKPVNDIDVMLLYWSVGYDEDQKLTFYKDIYNRDGKVLEQLDTESQSRLIRNTP